MVIPPRGEFRHRQGIAEVEFAGGADDKHAPVAHGLALAELMPKEQTALDVKPQEEL